MAWLVVRLALCARRAVCPARGQADEQVSPESAWLEPLTTIPKVVDPAAATEPS